LNVRDAGDPGDGSGTALWFVAPGFEVLAEFDDGVERTVEVADGGGPR
jgi:hypothetical protein